MTKPGEVRIVIHFIDEETKVQSGVRSHDWSAAKARFDFGLDHSVLVLSLHAAVVCGVMERLLRCSRGKRKGAAGRKERVGQTKRKRCQVGPGVSF